MTGREQPEPAYGELCDVLISMRGGGFHLGQGIQLGPEKFELVGSTPTDEVWEFQPGDVVRCIIKVLGPREAHWLAVGLSGPINAATARQRPSENAP
ncbi:MAG: hypothetical protein FJ303_18240 [Planctomycetes bacterium]|nr:hypothetical protein [Planctomycetota bacterium]